MKLQSTFFLALFVMAFTAVSHAQRSTCAITLSNAGVALSDTFGVAVGATECIDTALGENELHEIPPCSCLLAAFSEKACLGYGLSLDLQSGSTTEHSHARFKLHYQWENPDSALVLAWDTTGLSEKFDTLNIRDLLGGGLVNIDMLTSTSYTFVPNTDPAFLTDLNIIVGAKPITVLGTLTTKNNLPGFFALNQNYPNPFNPSTTIGYQLPSSARVLLKVYNMLGQEVATLVDGMQAAGYKTAKFEASNLPSGVYVYRFTTPTFSDVRKMLLVR